MAESTDSVGYFRNGMPYNRFGRGPRPLIIFQGLDFANRPLVGWMAKPILAAYKFLEADYTCYLVTRRPGLPKGYTMQNMADDYAALIRAEFGGPLDVLGLSTGGSIVLHFAGRHPELVRKLVVHSGAHTLSDSGRAVQMRIARLAEQGRWRQAWWELLAFMLPRGLLHRVMAGLGAWIMARSAPDDANDLVVTVEAEDVHACQGQLAAITAPALVIAGEQDPFFTPQLLRETAEGIPNARLVLYPKMGHPAGGKEFEREVSEFLSVPFPWVR